VSAATRNKAHGEKSLDNLTTDRLTIRPFEREDLSAVHRILNAAFGASDTEADVGSWLEWSRLNARWFPAMRQFPYGDRAVALAATGEVVAVAGYAPLLMPFDQIPELARQPGPRAPAAMSAEVGLFWAVDPPVQGRGYATEAAKALIRYAFDHLRLWRILATTEYDNYASQAVMLKAGMTLTRNPLPEPEWMQVVGVRYASQPSQEPPGLTT
jgi:[ribosomal protein S5]-alanine N-acetyltransferase